ncbi:MAG: hypothetical protein ACD_56C00141G0024 [uncultured bacterium]|nr:MAG: hypothetical protein ACD_56C00141G0024 [uncultured bacterium]
MKKIFLVPLLILSIFVFFIFIVNNDQDDFVIKPENAGNQIGLVEIPAVEKKDAEKTVDFSSLTSPLNKADERVTKKKFGTYVTPKNSPVQPEKFQGFHAGVDFEIFPGEEDIDVFVSAICSGRLLAKRTASGYGGVAVQSCDLGGKPVTVVYGHLELESIRHEVSNVLNAGDKLGFLGKGYSSQTDGERKHLHLGIHRGKTINILGYVNSRELLSDWIDPCLYFCKK